jgi:hypothetical protein
MTNTDQLLADWLEQKQIEQAANRARLKIETEIVAAFEVKDEGSTTHKTDAYKVTLTQPVTRSLDADKWNEVKDRLPSNMHPVKIELKADAAGMKYLAKNEPVLWASVAEAFTTKAGKIGVKVEKNDGN